MKNRARCDLRKFFFTNRVVNIWNSLPDYIVHADTVNCFKSRLDRIWYITSKPKSAEPEAEVKLYSKYYTNTLYLYLEPGIEARNG